MKSYDEFVAEALALPLDGRDPSQLDGRMIEASTPWSYPDRADELVRRADVPVLDMSAGDTDLGAGGADALPFADDRYAVVLNRHDRYKPAEVSRVLRADGVFFTEQIGGLDGLAINEALGAPLPDGDPDWALGSARAELEAAGLQVAGGRTAFPERLFHDIAALVYFLRKVPRQVPDFSIDGYDKQLRLLHDRMSEGEPFRDRAVRFLIEAVHP